MAEIIEGIGAADDLMNGVEELINGVEQDAVSGFGAVNRINRRRQGRNLISKAAAQGAARGRNTRSANLLMTERTSYRAWLEETKGLLPQYLQDKLASGEMQVSDTVIFSVKNSGNQNYLDMFLSGDAQVEGICNINKAQLEKDEMFLLCGVTVLFGARAAANDAPYTASFGDDYPAVLRQGRLTLSVGDVPIFHEHNFPLEMMNIDRSDLRAFHYPLAVPKWIKDQKTIQSRIFTPESLPALSTVKLLFHGVQLKSGSPTIR